MAFPRIVDKAVGRPVARIACREGRGFDGFQLGGRNNCRER
jgi:hypothetical protein